MKSRILLLALATVTLAVASAGCATKPKPPVFNLYTRARIAVLPFGNPTKDADLGGAVRAALVADLGRMNAVPLVDAPAGPAATASPWTDAAWRKTVADATGCDLILAGSVANYREELKSEEPKRVKSKLTYGSRWGWADVASVHLDATVMLLSAADGKVLWTRAVPGDGKQGRWIELPWPGDTSGAPPEGWDKLKAQVAPAPAVPGPDGLLRSTEPMMGRARADAIDEIVRTVTTDFAGKDGWEPPARTAQNPPAGLPAGSPQAPAAAPGDLPSKE